jgi:hypothetical protein
MTELAGLPSPSFIALSLRLPQIFFPGLGHPLTYKRETGGVDKLSLDRDSPSATAALAAREMTSSDRERSFFKKLEESFRRNDKPHLNMSSFTVIFESDESEKIKKPRFIFKSNNSDKGITCFRSEAIRVAKALPEMYAYLAETKESFEAEADKSNIEGRVHSEIIQKNEMFEKRLEIQIYNQHPILTLVLYLLETENGEPCPCPGSVIFKDGEDDPKVLLDFIYTYMPEKEQKIYKRTYARI